MTHDGRGFCEDPRQRRGSFTTFYFYFLLKVFLSFGEHCKFLIVLENINAIDNSGREDIANEVLVSLLSLSLFPNIIVLKPQKLEYHIKFETCGCHTKFFLPLSGSIMVFSFSIQIGEREKGKQRRLQR